MQKKILVILNHSLYVRNFISSGLLAKAAKAIPGVKFEVFVDRGSASRIAPGQPFNFKAFPREFAPGIFKRWLHRILREIGMASRWDMNTTYRHKLEVKKGEGPASWVLYRLAIFLSRFFPIEQWALGLERRIPPAKFCESFIEEFKPDLVFFVSVIHDQMNIIELLKAARNRKIPIYTYVASWDNLTSKGPFLLQPDKMLVWGRIHKDHGEQEHGYDREKIVPVGAPHFDVYFEQDSLYSRESFLKERGLDPNKKTIFFAGTTKHKSANEPEILRVLIEETKRVGSPLYNSQIWYRPHPRMLHDSTRHLRDLEGFFFDDQSKRQQDAQQHGYSVNESDIFHTARLLHSIDLVISAFSTMIIEAALIGKPSIIIKFAQGEGLLDDVLKSAKYKHLEDISAWKFVESAETIEDCARIAGKLLNMNPADYRNILIDQATDIANNPLASSQGEIIRVLANAVS